MTIIAWDGKTLAADRQSTTNNMRRATRKIYEVNDGLVAITGGACHGHALLDWFYTDRDPKNWPVSSKDGCSNIIHFTKAGIWVYAGDEPAFGEPVLSPFIAFGSGRDYAMAAMHLGKNAKDAVKIACLFDVSCGMGIDTLRLK